MRRVILGLLLALSGVLPATAGNESSPAPVLKVDKHMFASSIYLDKEGHCQPEGGRELRSWYVQGFPAKIPPFESCTTISSKNGNREVEIVLTVVGPKNRKLLSVDGVLELGSDGRASQAINWEHLEIPAAGTYFMAIQIEGREVARFPMRFRLKRTGKK